MTDVSLERPAEAPAPAPANPFEGAIDVALHVSTTLGWAMQQSGIPIVRDVVVTNRAPVPLIGASFYLVLRPELGAERATPIPEVRPGESVTVDAVDHELPADRLRNVTTSEAAVVEWSVRRDGLALTQGTRDVRVLARDE